MESRISRDLGQFDHACAVFNPASLAILFCRSQARNSASASGDKTTVILSLISSKAHCSMRVNSARGLVGPSCGSSHGRRPSTNVCSDRWNASWSFGVPVARMISARKCMTSSRWRSSEKSNGMRGGFVSAITALYPASCPRCSMAASCHKNFMGMRLCIKALQFLYDRYFSTHIESCHF